MARTLRLRRPIHQSGSPTECPRNLHPRRSLTAWSESPLHAACLENPHAWNEVCAHAWLGLDETMELLSRVSGAGEEDPDLSALYAALKTKLGFCEPSSPPPTMSRGVELLASDVKSCRGIRSSPMDTYPSPFHPRVRTVPVCSVGDTSEAEMKSYGLAALAPLGITHPSPASGGTGDPGVPSRGTMAIATANLHIEPPEFDPKNLPEWVEECLEFLLLTGQEHIDVRTKCTLIKKACKKKFP